MKIAVIGAGGVGGYFGAKMALAGYDVTFVARGEHLKAIRENGLTVKSVDGDFAIHPAHVTGNIQDVAGSDYVVMGVKAWQVREIARDLSLVLSRHTSVLPLQNGVLAREDLAAEMDNSHILDGICRIFSKIEAPGIITHLGMEPTIIFGEQDNRKSQRVLELKKILDTAGIHARIADDIQSEIWKKFIGICASGLLAVTRSTYGQIREIPEVRKMMVDLFREIYQISQKIGIAIDPDFVEKIDAFTDTFPYNSTSSLSRDVCDGKPSEIEYQNGTVVRLGEKYGVNTPVNRFIYNCILPMERKARQLYSPSRAGQPDHQEGPVQ